MILTPKPSSDDDNDLDGGDNSGDGVVADEADVDSESQEPTIEASTAALPVVDMSLPDEGEGMEEEDGLVVPVEAVAEILQDLVVDDLSHLTTDIAHDDSLIAETEVPLMKGYHESVMMRSNAAVTDEAEVEVEEEHGAVEKDEEDEDLGKEDTTEDSMNSHSYIVASDDQQGDDESSVEKQDQNMEVEVEVEELLSVDNNNDDESHQEGHGHTDDEGDALEHSTTSTSTASNDDTIDRGKDEL